MFSATRIPKVCETSVPFGRYGTSTHGKSHVSFVFTKLHNSRFDVVREFVSVRVGSCINSSNAALYLPTDFDQRWGCTTSKTHKNKTVVSPESLQAEVEKMVESGFLDAAAVVSPQAPLTIHGWPVQLSPALLAKACALRYWLNQRSAISGMAIGKPFAQSFPRASRPLGG